MPKIYPPEFKRDVADAARRRGEDSLEDVAHTFGVSPSSVKRWLQQADADDGVTDGLTSDEKAELSQLRRDKRRLEMEVEILRRATAFFAKDAPQNDGSSDVSVGVVER